MESHAFGSGSPLSKQGEVEVMEQTFDNKAFDSSEDGVESAQSQKDVSVEVTPEFPVSTNGCERAVNVVQTFMRKQHNRHRRVAWIVMKILLLCLYFAFFGYAMSYEFGNEGSWRLLIGTILGVLLLSWSLGGHLVLRALAGEGECCQTAAFQRFRTVFRWSLYVAMAVFMVLYTGVVIGRENPRNLISLSGIAVFILIFFIFSTDPARVNWHPVFWGISLQYVFALLVLKTTWGRAAFQWLGDRVTELLSYTDAGSDFVFSKNKSLHPFAFQVLPTIIYFSALISMLYQLGIMQWVIGVIGRFLSFCLETSATESLNAAGNIFVGMTEAPLMVRPFLSGMTNSELHAIMTGGFATVSGSILGAYVSYGVNASHLLGASVMSAPAALALSKLLCPETEKTSIDPNEVFKLGRGTSRNAIEALSEGASAAIPLVANVAVNVLAFLAVLEFLNATLQWFGTRIGVDGLTFQFLCSYVFYPIAFFMGVEPRDCRRVAELIGFKTFTNEFVAYIKMGDLITNGNVFNNYTQSYNMSSWSWHGEDVFLEEWNVTLTKGYLLPRSEMIATYALCGFSNLGAMGIQLGAFGAMAPTRKSDLSRLVLRAMITGNVACFLTACIAGLFYDEQY